MEHKSYPTPHVLIFPVPLQGHLTPMLNLAEILCLANLKVTFLNTTYNQKRLAKHTDIEARFGRYPGFTFKTVPDGLPDDHPRSGDKTFITTGANFIWTFQCLPKMIAGMDSFLRYRDLPCFFRDKDISVFGKLQDQFNGEIQKIKQAHTFILNTFEDLEGPILSLIREHWRGVYTIGPLHAHLKYRLNPKDTTLSNTSSSDLWEVDRSCISWLDQKPEKSVVYASFGTITTFTKDQLMEFWAGLVQSKKYFLWVIKSDNITGSGSESPAHDDLVQGTKERGYIVSWAPQEEVLAHRAVGGFFTHSGRGSVLESIVAGVPMLCWPYFSDHQIVNTRNN